VRVRRWTATLAEATGPSGGAFGGVERPSTLARGGAAERGGSSMGKTWISRAKRELKTARPISVPNSAVMRGDIVDGAVA